MDDFESIRVTRVGEWVLYIALNRTRKLNTMTAAFFTDLKRVFDSIAADGSVRAVVLSAEQDSKVFTAGLDLTEVSSFPSNSSSDSDPAREALKFIPMVRRMQDVFNAIEQCNKPVIAAVHGICIGGGIDLITACDIRFASKEAIFNVKEVDIGIAADLGTLQRLPKVTGNESWVRDISLTARNVPASEALQFGLVSRVVDDPKSLIQAALDTAALIASKAPLSTLGTKHILNHARDHSVADGLQYVGLWNSVMINSSDTLAAASSAISKKKTIFPKL